MCSIDLVMQLDHLIPPRSLELRREVALTTVAGIGSEGDILHGC